MAAFRPALCICVPYHSTDVSPLHGASPHKSLPISLCGSVMLLERMTAGARRVSCLLYEGWQRAALSGNLVSPCLWRGVAAQRQRWRWLVLAVELLHICRGVCLQVLRVFAVVVSLLGLFQECYAGVAAVAVGFMWRSGVEG